MPAVSPIVHAQSAQVGIGERESRRYWGQQLVVRGQLHSPLGKLVMRVAHVAPIRARCFNSKRTSFHVALELEHVESVDLRSEVRKADAVLPVFARAGQRSDTLKRVARRGRCRLLFLLGVQHIDAMGIGASSKKLEEFEAWRRRRAAKRNNLVGNARRDNSRAIDRAEKAAAAAAASEARSSSANAGPSVRGHSNIPSPLLARLTTRSIAQRSGSKTALARLWRVARETVSSLLAAVRQVLPWIEVAHYLDKFGAPPRSTTAPSKRLAHLRSSECRVPRRAHRGRARRRCGTVDLD